MAVGLNLAEPFSQLQKVYKLDYFIDKSKILKEFVPLMGTDAGYICITRPRRFGKTIMAQLLSSYFSKGIDSSEIFDRLAVRKESFYHEHLNRHDVIYIDFSEMPWMCSGYQNYLNYFNEMIIESLTEHFPELDLKPDKGIWAALDKIFKKTGTQFIFIIDEWDALFQKRWSTESNRNDFIDFLGTMLKNKAYVKFVYMTGVLPIKKYSSGSSLNMFYEYNVAQTLKYSEYFGFTHEETNQLYDRYLTNCTKNGIEPKVTIENLYLWYDGYQASDGSRVYNPRSIIRALMDNAVGNYWTETGPFSEVLDCIRYNVDAVREDIVRMVAGKSVTANLQEFAANQMNMASRDEILSAMVVYGFLTCEGNQVRIPNQELMEKFEWAINQKEMGYVYRLANESKRMLQATLEGDTDTMESILSTAHDTEIPVLRYNDEGDLASLVNLIFLAARDEYDPHREENTGRGRADVLYYPNQLSAPGIIIELKVDDTPENAIKQIKDKHYIQNFEGGLAGRPRYTGKILAVGMAYSSKTKEHKCKVEILREKL